ncbi:MAG TPA: prepilin-type N-terminal cleavage/methylation domain-containing protein [Chromatiales bacterium]|nr:prepilin-type N-terminal cleavage/methylation domain-containing protein [Chromatiales bacterium]
MSGSRTPARGFTLIELIIALSLTGVIAALAYGGLHLAARGWDRASQVAMVNDEARVAWGFVRARLAQARPVLQVIDDEVLVRFEGEPSLLRFVAPPPRQQAAQGGLYVYSLEVADDGLWLDYALYLPDGREISQEPPRLLVKGVDDRRVFSYFGAIRPDDDRRWHTMWDRVDRLPELVRVELHVDGQGWPAWVMPIRAGGE